MKSKLLAEEESHAIALDSEIIEEETLYEIESEQVSIETNKAFNEAESFIRDLEQERATRIEESKELEEAETVSEEAIEKIIPAKAKKTKDIVEKPKDNSVKKINQVQAATKTTIRYNLAGRTALELPNPVYTCDTGGKVVITIEVNDYGKVIKASYNKSASTTDNGCLIDSALEYANASKFSSQRAKKKQLGSISYSFPGQQG